MTNKIATPYVAGVLVAALLINPSAIHRLCSRKYNYHRKDMDIRTVSVIIGTVGTWMIYR